MLFGVAGFLEAPDLAVYPEETRGYVQETLGPLVAASRRNAAARSAGKTLAAERHPPAESSAAPARRARHSRRCVAVVHQIAREEKREDRASDFFLGLRHPFWNFHYTLASDPAAREMALVGESRIAEILANVLLPFFLAEGAEVWAAYEKLPARLSNRRLETGADPALRRRSAPSALHENHRAAARLASDLRRLLLAG